MLRRLLARLLSRSPGTAPPAPETALPKAGPGLDAQCAAAGLDPAAWVAEFRTRPALYADLDAPAARALAERFPDQAAQTLAGAEAALAHTFDLLGSGPFTPHDPARPARESGYRPLDWYLDPVRGLRFPEKVPHKEWNLYAMRPGNADVKYPWELARCQHFAALGQAWRSTGRACFALEVADQIEDFMEANPVGLGVNWTCTMDVAIRAANWAIGLGLVRDCPDLPDTRLRGLLGHLLDHGTFIAANFEDHYEVTSNHYLSNVVGLHLLSSALRGLPAAGEWDAYCRERVEREMQTQVLPDGADFESSLPYHRLVLELFLGSARLAAWQGRPLSGEFAASLERMADYLAAMLRPDGRMPVWGDADDGRLHVLTDWLGWDRQDGRHVLAPAALHLGPGDLLAYAREDDLWEAAWWGFDVAGLEPGPGDLPPVSRLFPQAGGAVYRNRGAYLLAANSIVGTQGFGNHKHNDQLAFELHLDGAPLIVDPGSFVYTSDFAARNRFRSTASHATLMVDGQEQNEMNPEWIFRMFAGQPPHHLWLEHGAEAFEYGGLHRGYERLEQPATHLRALRLLTGPGVLLVADIMVGDGERDLSWRFPLAPGHEPAPGGPDWCGLGREDLVLRHPPSLAREIVPAWASPSYGVREECHAVGLRARAGITAPGPGQAPWWGFAIGPRAAAEAAQEQLPRLARRLAAAFETWKIAAQ